MTGPKWTKAHEDALERAKVRPAGSADGGPMAQRPPPALSVQTLARAAELLEEQREKNRRWERARRARRRAQATERATTDESEGARR